MDGDEDKMKFVTIHKSSWTVMPHMYFTRLSEGRFVFFFSQVKDVKIYVSQIPIFEAAYFNPLKPEARLSDILKIQPVPRRKHRTSPLQRSTG
jgi:hypothetical protein